MKKIKLLGVLFSAFVLIQSCGGSSCYTCTNSFFGVSTESKYCKGDANITTTTAGVSSTSASNGISVDDFKKSFESLGYTCK